MEQNNEKRRQNLKDKIKIFLIIVITSFCLYKIILWILVPSYAASSGKTQSDEQLIARAINGEARGESEEGRRGVAWTVVNRHNKSGKTVQEEATKSPSPLKSP